MVSNAHNATGRKPKKQENNNEDARDDGVRGASDRGKC